MEHLTSQGMEVLVHSAISYCALKIARKLKCTLNGLNLNPFHALFFHKIWGKNRAPVARKSECNFFNDLSCVWRLVAMHIPRGPTNHENH